MQASPPQKGAATPPPSSARRSTYWTNKGKALTGSRQQQQQQKEHHQLDASASVLRSSDVVVVSPEHRAAARKRAALSLLRAAVALNRGSQDYDALPEHTKQVTRSLINSDALEEALSEVRITSALQHQQQMQQQHQSGGHHHHHDHQQYFVASPPGTAAGSSFRPGSSSGSRRPLMSAVALGAPLSPAAGSSSSPLRSASNFLTGALRQHGVDDHHHPHHPHNRPSSGSPASTYSGGGLSPSSTMRGGGNYNKQQQRPTSATSRRGGRRNKRSAAGAGGGGRSRSPHQHHSISPNRTSWSPKRAPQTEPTNINLFQVINEIKLRIPAMRRGISSTPASTADLKALGENMGRIFTLIDVSTKGQLTLNEINQFGRRMGGETQKLFRHAEMRARLHNRFPTEFPSPVMFDEDVDGDVFPEFSSSAAASSLAHQQQQHSSAATTNMAASTSVHPVMPNNTNAASFQVPGIPTTTSGGPSPLEGFSPAGSKVFASSTPMMMTESSSQHVPLHATAAGGIAGSSASLGAISTVSTASPHHQQQQQQQQPQQQPEQRIVTVRTPNPFNDPISRDVFIDAIVAASSHKWAARAPAVMQRSTRARKEKADRKAAAASAAEALADNNSSSHKKSSRHSSHHHHSRKHHSRSSKLQDDAQSMASTQSAGSGHSGGGKTNVRSSSASSSVSAVTSASEASTSSSLGGLHHHHSAIPTDPEMRAQFFRVVRLCDPQNTGYITCENLRRACPRTTAVDAVIGPTFSVKALFDRHDLQGTGKLSIEEFADMLAPSFIPPPVEERDTLPVLKDFEYKGKKIVWAKK